jgi:nicotinate-nucleotide pyrophosphorylase (carboxylating)
MKRIEILKKIFVQTETLHVTNKRYAECVRAFTMEEIKRDAGDGDLTSLATLDSEQRIRARVLAKEKGIVAGVEEITYFLNGQRGIKFNFKKKDGEEVKFGEIVLEVEGFARELMKVERVILNVIGRLSGIATLTAKLTAKARKSAKNVIVAGTRKTFWGMIDKKACAIGGGGTHRLSLSNAILIKHNHLNASGLKIEKLLERVFARVPHLKIPPKFIDVEIKNPKDAKTAARVINNIDAKNKIPCVIMFDNMTPKAIKKTLMEIKNFNKCENLFFEASGRITAKNITSYALCGVDVLSLGALTHSSAMLDFSMRVIFP